MGKAREFIRSLSGVSFWLLVTVMSAISVLLILAAFQIIKFSRLRWW